MRQRLEALERQLRAMPKLPYVDGLLKDVFALQHLMVNAIENLSSAGLALDENLLVLKESVDDLRLFVDGPECVIGGTRQDPRSVTDRLAEIRGRLQNAEESIEGLQGRMSLLEKAEVDA